MTSRGESYFPVLLRLQGRRCVVVGPLAAAWERAQALRACGAEVCIVSPEGEAAEVPGPTDAGIEVHRRPFRVEDLKGAWMVVSVVSDPTWNAGLYQAAEAQGTLCYVVDDPEHSHFIRPAVWMAGPVVVAVSTGGMNPRLAQVLRDRCASVITEADVHLAVLLGDLRPRLRQALPDSAARRAFVDRLMDSEVMIYLRQGAFEQARQAAEALLTAFADGAAP
ncbi:MAG: bifunctional precorrin-2 dehydrogenase/sirohydrochlorin ferrochelatase [Acidobacteria bacterium]|nr:bifunctional precorrin-2 dehydrogenase/sirohydrochlorin ferrochelatase [Acidobacteriota bacterium]MDW7983637.1 bifunctional precorrin-2 dehydrogenase/sirohydrochlorin ferrochelatase [Acidobacteriota bacterium]